MNTKQLLTAAILLTIFVCALPVPAKVAAVSSRSMKTSFSVFSLERKKKKIRGFITQIISPTSFEIDDYKITRDEALILDFENQGADINFKPGDLRVGTEIEVQGLHDEESGEMTATKISIDLDQFRKLKNTTVLTRDPENVRKTEKGWQGVFWADGRRVRIDETTQVLFELNKTEKKEAAKEIKEGKETKKTKNQADSKKKESKKSDDAITSDVKSNPSETTSETPAVQTVDADKLPENLPEEDEFTGSEPLKNISEVRSGMFATYEGIEQSDGTVLVSRIIFIKNELEKGEEQFWKSLKIKEKTANFTSGSPGELKIDRIGKFKLLPNKEVQDYVARIGESLIPAYQRSLPADSPQKIPFKFYVISNKQVNAFATANGIVVINSGMLTMLENEAQLAAVIAHEISHATQEHSWRQLNKDKGKRRALMIGGIAAAAFGLPGVNNILQLTLAAMVNGYQRRLENQADRIGLEYMTAAGYDPREAPRVWKLMAKKNGDMPTNFFWSSHENHATRRSFLMVEIRNNYADLDFTNLKKGDVDDYEKIVTMTTEAAQKKKKIKVKIAE